jgi:hypothetical protein
MSISRRLLLMAACAAGISFLHPAEAFEAPRNPTPEDVNRVFGIPLVSAGNLWDEPDKNVAERLGLNRESETSYESGYRLYPHDEASVLGSRLFSIFLQGMEGRASRLSFIFANKGDISVYATQHDERRALNSENHELPVSPQMIQAYQAAIRRDGDHLRQRLNALFGDSVPVTLGRVAGLEERGERWDWQGISFTLSSPRNEYVALRIFPTKEFDDPDVERHSFAAARALIPGRIVHRSNGDVVITDLPMVDQGAKGYCVPATYERVLRYYGLYADMNLLAMAGETQAGGGTSASRIASAAYELVREAGGKITTGIEGAGISDIQPYIDKGEPVLWALYSSDELNERLGDRLGARLGVTDAKEAKEWNEKVLPSIRADARTLPREGGHVCLIIGYNRLTREIAISDSWGPEFAERWLTEEEAKAINQGESTVIGW